MRLLWIAVLLVTGDGLLSLIAAQTQSGRDFILAVPAGSEFSLDIQSSSGDEVSCDIIIAEHDSTSTHKTPITTPHTLLEVEDGYTIQTAGALSSHRISVSCQEDVYLKLSSGGAVSMVPPVNSLSSNNFVLSSQVVVASASDESIDLKADSDGAWDTTQISTEKSLWLAITGSNAETPKVVETTGPALVLSGTKSGDKIHLCAVPPSDTWGKEYIIDEPGKYKLISLDEDVTCSTPDSNEVTVSSDSTTVDLAEAGVLSCNDGPVLVLKLDTNEAVVGAISSTSQFVNDATLISPETEDNYTMHITVEDEHVNDELIIDDEPVVNQTDIAKEPINDKFVKIKFTVPGGGRKYRIRHKMPTVRFHPRMTDSQNQEVAMPPLNMAPLGKASPDGVEPEANDGVDNDGDYRVDEELLNSVDDDGDGLIDEDTSSNEYYGDNRHKKWPLSYTVVILVILVFLLLVVIAVCHYKCKQFDPVVKEQPHENAMVTSYDSRVPNQSGYSLSGTWDGFTLSRR